MKMRIERFMGCAAPAEREKQIPHPTKGAGIRNDSVRVGRFLVTLALALAGMAMAVTAQAQKLQMPPHERVVLPNGLTVLLLEKHSVPMVNVAGIIKTGGLADPPGLEGPASTTAGL